MTKFILCVVISLCSGVFSMSLTYKDAEWVLEEMRGANLREIPKAAGFVAKRDAYNYIDELKKSLAPAGCWFINTCDEGARGLYFENFRVSRVDRYYYAVNETHIAEIPRAALRRQLGEWCIDRISLADTFSSWMGPKDRFMVCDSESLSEIAAYRKEYALLEKNEKKACMTLYLREPFLAYLKELKEQELGSSVEIVDAFEPVVDLKMKVAARRGDDFINVDGSCIYAKEVVGDDLAIVEESKANGEG